MKTTARKVMAVIMGIALASVFAIQGGSANAQGKTGFLLGYYDKMQPVAKSEGAGKMRWLKPGVDFS